ncbi:Fc receptor-like protein 5 isoform X1 [Brachyistius frenatus]|uniref:Fc receptor-like protein 5 isoform X1 n=1 Tax=Brachyistius frenatus TaxID=100188 RepID=UPI0037E7FABB
MKNRQTLHLVPILALASLLIKITGSSSPQPVLTGPDMAYLGSKMSFRCRVPESSTPITYKLMKDGGVLMAVDADLHGDQSASFPMKVAAASEGSYHCEATAGGNTGVSNSIRLSVVTPALDTRVTSDPSPPSAYEGSRIVLSCDVKTGSHLSFSWFFNGKEVTSSTSTFFHLTGNKLVMERATAEHAGNYLCMAWSMVQNMRRISSSTEVQVTVKVYVSKPKISFSIFKEGVSYRGNVTCWSPRGSPPVNFSLSLDDKEVGSVTATESLAAWFHVAMVPGLDMGVARCRATTELQELMSEPLTLEVVPVGGDVKVEVEYLYNAESKLVAARLSCQVSRGTFPDITWLLNDSVLHSASHTDSHLQPIPPPFALTDRRRTLVLSKVSPEESGYYRCRARDSYDQSGPWIQSAAELVRVTDRILYCTPPTTSCTETPPKFSRTTVEVLSLAFSCFVFLMLAVGSACLYNRSDQDQAHVHNAPTNSEAFPLSDLTSQSGN